MKVRSDFVSNSSSSSFVVACKKQYLDVVVKDLSKACACKKSYGHNSKLAATNKRILDFCLDTYQLLFLGSLVIDTKKEIYNLEYFNNICKKHSKNVSGLKFWNDYKKEMIKAKNDPNCYPWMKKEYSRDIYDEAKDEAIHFTDIVASEIVVSNNNMEYMFNRYHYSPDTAETISNRVESLVDAAKKTVSNDEKTSSFIGTPEIYQITQDTIDNTKNLIDAGYKVELEKWENLDELNARIANGDAIFYVKIARDGDGYGDYHIFCEDEADGLDAVSGIEILTSDSL